VLTPGFEPPTLCANNKRAKPLDHATALREHTFLFVQNEMQT
jgi:hypothetical protein